MFRKRKGFSPSHSKRMSRSMDSSTIGTHVTRGRHGRPATRRPNAEGVEFSNARKGRRAVRGYVDQVAPATSTRESDEAYSRRTGRRGYVQEIQHKKRVRRATFLVAAVALVAVVAVGAGVFTYFASSDSRLSLAHSNASEALVAAGDAEPSYLLAAAELGTATAAGGAETEAYLLVRLDPANRVLTFLSIPSSIEVKLSDGETHPLYEACALGGDAELVRAVAAFAGVDIAHFGRTNAQGIMRLVDVVGGVDVDVVEEVDDPRASTVVIAAGQRTLDARESLAFLRATNYVTGIERQAANQVAFSVSLANEALSSEGIGFAARLADMAEWVETDWNSSQIMALGDALRPLDTATVYAGLVPGRMTESDGRARYVVSDGEWEAMMESVRAGASPQAPNEAVTSLDRTAVTVEIRNGGGVTGAGAKMGELLTADGYQVTEIGNANDGGVYTETLVVYKDPAYEAAAKAIVADAGVGRVVNGGDFYTFKDNVLVMVGQDWVPVG